VLHRFAPEFRGAKVTKSLARRGAAAIALVTLFGVGQPLCAGELAPWGKGSQPSFTLPSIAGVDVSLGARRGGTVLVHFFATWCELCRNELPALARLSERTSLKIIAISVAEPDIRVQRFLQSTPVGFPVLLDRDRAVAKAWQVETLPTTFVLDSQLSPRFVVEGDYSWDALDQAKLNAAMAAQQHALTQNTEGTNDALR